MRHGLILYYFSSNKRLYKSVYTRVGLSGHSGEQDSILKKCKIKEVTLISSISIWPDTMGSYNIIDNIECRIKLDFIWSILLKFDVMFYYIKNNFLKHITVVHIT